MEKTHWKKLQHPDYIGAYALMDGSEKGTDLVVTVEKVIREQVTGADGKKEECTVAYLRGQKPMILNTTNQKTMSKLFGSPYIEDWAGKSMTLYVARVKSFGDMVEALRIRDKPPVISLPELTPQHPKWEGARKAVIAKNTTIEAIKKQYSLTPQNEALLCSV